MKENFMFFNVVLESRYLMSKPTIRCLTN